MREKHLFQFTAKQISEAAGREAKYHEDRIAHWKQRKEAAIQKAKTSGVKVEEYQHSGGSDARIIIDDSSAVELSLATNKIGNHQRAVETFRSEEACYGSQGDRTYELDGADVMHFRLAGGAREE